MANEGKKNEAERRVQVQSMDARDQGRGYQLLVVFLAILVLAIAAYVGLHLWRPAGLLAPDTTALGIARQANTLLATAQDAPLSSADRTTLSEQADQLNILLPRLTATQEISPTLAAIRAELGGQAPRRMELATLFDRLEQVLQLNQGSFFWSGSSDRWVEMGFWALFGILVFLLSEIKKYFTMPYDATEPCETKRNFSLFTPWYIVNLVRGPFIAIAILLALSGISVEIVGVSLNIRQAPIEALIFLAAILGFYSRVAEKQLDAIVAKLFPDAAVKVGLSSAIQPQAATLGPNESQSFQVLPERPVTWVLQGEGSLEDGKYTAPPTIDKSGDAIVWAVPKDGSLGTARAIVTLKRPAAPPDGTGGNGHPS